MTRTLHYIHDPLCGWCYGAAPLLRIARELMPVRAHGGGMMSGARRQRVTPELREFVCQHDRHIAQLSGQAFGEAYTEGLLRDHHAVFDSEPPTAAMLAAEQLDGRGLDMLAAMQRAHYIEGRRIADHAVLIEVAEGLGLSVEAFAVALEAHGGAVVQAHFHETHDFMRRVGAQGFPTFVLETDAGLQRLELLPFLGKPEALRDSLRAEPGVTAVSTGDAALACDITGCVR